MKLLRAVGVLGGLCASGALAQEVPPSEPVVSEVPKPSEQKEGFRFQFGAQLGYALGFDIEGGDNGGPGARVQLLARVNDYLAMGPEAAFYLGAGSMTYITPNGPPYGGESARTEKGALVVLSGVLRLGLDRGPLRPSVVMGPALMGAKSDGGLGYFLGLEVGIAPGKVPVVLDGRYYKPLNGSATGYPHYYSLGLGTRF